MIKRTAVVHVGLEKTGSTALQQWLSLQAAQRAASGILMPQSIGFPNHTKLVAACLDDGAIDNIKSYQLFASGCSEQRFRARVFDDLDREIKAAVPGWHTLLITSELISSRLSTPSELDRLFGLIGRYVDAIKIVIFLRRQDQLALSRFSSILRSGHAQFDDVFVDYSSSNFIHLPDDRPVSDDLFFYDFAAILARFAAVPDATLHVYAYGQDSPLAVMARLLALSLPPSEPGGERHNSALSAEAQYILAQLNAVCPVQFASGMRNHAYRQLQRRVETEVKGSPRTVSREQASQFLCRYDAINRQVAEQYRNGLPLFSGDLSRYPESVDYSTFSNSLAGQLSHYRRLADALPTREPVSQLFRYRLRRSRHFIAGLLRGGR